MGVDMHKGQRIYLLQKIIRRSVCEIAIDICSGRTSLNTSYYQRNLESAAHLSVRTKGRQDISSFDGVLEFCVNTAQYFSEDWSASVSLSVLSSHQFSNFSLPATCTLMFLLWLIQVTWIWKPPLWWSIFRLTLSWGLLTSLPSQGQKHCWATQLT